MSKPWTKDGKVLEQVPIHTRHGTKMGGRWKSMREEPGTKYFPRTAVPGEKAVPVTWHQAKERYEKKHAKGETFSQFLHKYYAPYSKGDSTKGMYHGDEQRKRLHSAIVKNIVDQANTPPAGQKPIAVLMGGGAASGKSFVRSTVIDPAMKDGGVRLGVCDPDDMKTRLPEWDYLVQTDPDHAGTITHRESVQLANEAFYALMKSGKNLVYDNSMRVVGEYRKKIRDLHEHGYNVVIIGVTSDIDVALERASKRERKMPEYKVRETHSGFATAWEFIKGYADDYRLYDTSDGTLEEVDSIHGVRNPDLMEKFHSRGKNGARRAKMKTMADRFGADIEVLWDMYRDGMSFDAIEQALKEVSKA